MASLAGGVRCATDVTGFGLLGHLFKLARASGVGASAIVTSFAQVPAANHAGYSTDLENELPRV